MNKANKTYIISITSTDEEKWEIKFYDEKEPSLYEISLHGSNKFICKEISSNSAFNSEKPVPECSAKEALFAVVTKRFDIKQRMINKNPRSVRKMMENLNNGLIDSSTKESTEIDCTSFTKEFNDQRTL